ncbi:LuxR family two component transcriptional regulator [Flavobacterium sp. 1]|uniref:response regulator transcription factor n=1 Tax=Flavobacterium sp. 1 TaxID=2035200 RepID=UPI000C23C2E4|nr:response regulator transcription factor [Flavobacterium sp. 1]PJJ07025.1 LuxR family two component transcriptional regulator [Flavobacterium sp. 1]
MDKALKMILVDDEVLFRKGISFLLTREKNIEVLFEASNGLELMEFLKGDNSKPDIIVMDLKMPFLNGIEATKIIRRDYPDIKIIALTSYDSKSFIANMIDVGAVSYLVKNTTPQELFATINEVAEKGFYYSDYVLNIIQKDIVTNKKTKCSFDSNFITSRELEVLQLICKQKSTVEIGEKLFISPRTVEGHRNNLLLKTESKNIAGLVVFAIQHELVSLDI